MHLIDSHCHLDFPEFDSDRVELINKCQQQGVKQFIVPGVTVSTWSRLQNMAAIFPECLIAYGLHPYFLNEHQLSHIDKLKKLIKIDRPIAVGEIGLDYYLKDLDKQKQQDFFHAQLALAVEYDLPVILHVRKAHDEVLQALRKYKVKGGTAHAFNGSMQQAAQYIALGFKLGFGGALTFDNATHLRKLARELPLEAIVLETDAPDMRPANSPSSRNTPLTIIDVLEVLSFLRQESVEFIADKTTFNVMSVFDLN